MDEELEVYGHNQSKYDHTQCHNLQNRILSEDVVGTSWVL